MPSQLVLEQRKRTVTEMEGKQTVELCCKIMTELYKFKESPTTGKYCLMDFLCLLIHAFYSLAQK